MTWRSQAACRSKPTSWWFAYPKTWEHDQAEAICHGCPVATECAAEGRRRVEWGRWGNYVHLIENGRRPRLVEFRCERCNVVVTLARHSGQLRRCDDCLNDDPATHKTASKRALRKRQRGELERAVAAFEAFVADAGLEAERVCR